MLDAPPSSIESVGDGATLWLQPDFRKILLRCGLVFVVGFWLSLLPRHPYPFVALSFETDLPWLAVFGVGLSLAAFTPGVRWADALINTASRRIGTTTFAVAVGVCVIGLVGTFAVFHGYALSRDEAMAQFDETIISHGRLIWPVPAQWRSYVGALEPAFLLPVRDNIGWISSYLPINAAIRAAFGAIASPVLAGPALAALSIFALSGIGRRLWPGRPDAIVVSILMLATSSQCLMVSMTTYAMTAHLALNMLWLWLFLRDDTPSHGGAVLVGALATGLHQLVFHPLFVMPFVLSLWATRRFRLAAFYTASYSLIAIFWIAYWQIMLHANDMEGASTTAASAFAGKVWDLIRAFNAGDIQIIVGNLVRFVTWQNPILVPLVIVATVHMRTMPRTLVLAAWGIVATAVVIFAVLPYQGYGWGYRYFHGILGSFALLAGQGWIALTANGSEKTRRTLASNVIFAGAFAIMILFPTRAFQTEAFVAPFARAYDLIRHADSDVVFVDADAIPYATDLVRNDPLLTNTPLVFDLWSLDEARVLALCATHDISVFDQTNRYRPVFSDPVRPVPRAERSTSRDDGATRLRAPYSPDRRPMNRPLGLTVVLPTHHGERWLETTFNSLVAQTYDDFDCLMIDSSATGETIAIAQRFRDRLRLRIEARPDIKDWQGKTNLGAALAERSHLCMLHQDDVWEPERAAHVVRWIAAAPEAIMHIHPTWIIDDRGRRLGRWRLPLPAPATLTGETFLERLIVQNTIAICSPVVTRVAFLASGGLDRALWYTADWDLYLKLTAMGSIISHSEILTGYRIHSEALTTAGSRTPQALEDQMRLVLDRYVANIPPARRGAIEASARAAIVVNTAMAGALNGDAKRLASAASAVLSLGPLGIPAFFRDTRLIDRLLPRLRAHLAGRLAPRQP